MKLPLVIAYAKMMNDPTYIPILYGRRQDKDLKPRHLKLMETLLPKIAVPEPADGPLDLKALFPQAEEIWLEVGFGGGEHLAWQAAQNPSCGLIGAEPFVNGVGKLLVHVEDGELQNVRIHFADARPLMEVMPDASLSRLFVLHPDPWPKKRHHKRRVISAWFFAEAARILKPGAMLRVASDIPDYIRWTLMHAQGAAQNFEWTAKCADDWRFRPEDCPQTRYEAKAIREGRTPCYLTFRRQ